MDSTVLADWLFNGGKMRDAALELQSWDGDWLCAALVRYEVGNVAWKLMRAGRLTMPDVLLAWEAINAAGIRMIDELDWQAVSELATVKEISYYDAAHVWLALSLGLPMYSRDRALMAKCPEVVRAMPEV